MSKEIKIKLASATMVDALPEVALESETPTAPILPVADVALPDVATAVVPSVAAEKFCKKFLFVTEEAFPWTWHGK